MSERLARYVPITQWLPALRAVVPRQRSARRSRRLGGARAAGRRLRRAGRCAAAGRACDGARGGRAVRRLRHLPRARRRPELDDRDHRGGGARLGRGRVSRPRSTRRSSPPSRMLTGVVLVVAGALRLGFVSEFLARPVLVGFISGIGVLIIVGQLPKLLGLTVESGNVPEIALARDRLARRDRLGDTGRRLPVAARAPRAPPGRAEGSVGARRLCRRGRGQPRVRPPGARCRRDRRRARRACRPLRSPGSASARSARSAAGRSRSRSSRWRSRSAPRARSRRSGATRSTRTRSSSRSGRPISEPACCRASRSTRASRAARSVPGQGFAHASRVLSWPP